MPILITDNARLKGYIPNQIATVKGELSLFDKLSPFLDIAEQWLFRHFIPENLLDVMTGEILECATRITALEAYRIALPQLDVVLTPNGLATVGTQNLVAASKPRVDRLIAGLVADRDNTIARMLILLPAIEEWRNSSQGRWFGATLFPNLDLCAETGQTERLWDNYVILRQKTADIEASLSEEWFSEELMSALRAENFSGKLTLYRGMAIRQIQYQVVACLREGAMNSRRLADIVTHIRNRPNEFPEWFNSDIADIFNPPVFRNEKEAKGFFF